MRRFCHVALVLSGMLLLSTGHALSGERRLVLVAGPESRPLELSMAEVRQLFLGYAVSRDDHEITAAINKSDELLYEVFLQKIVFMSSQTYERQLVSKVFRHGGQLPPTFGRSEELAEQLARRRGLVTFMWEDAARQLPNVTVVTELWRGSIE